MARFYFDVCSHGQKIVDTVGVDCENLGAAFQQAKTIIGQFRNAYDVSATHWSSWVLEVTYADHSTLFTLPFTLAGVST